MKKAFRTNNKKQNFTIRLAQNSDMSQIITTQLISLEKLATKDYRPKQIKALLASKSDRRSKFEIIFVAEINCQIIGFAALDHYKNSLAGLFVHPDYIRQGIGTQLLTRVEQEAIDLNIPILWVCASLTGYPFYLANQYQEINKTTILLDFVAIPCIQMKKRLLVPSKSEKIKEIFINVLIYLFILSLLFILVAKF